MFQEPAASNSTNSKDILIRPGTRSNKGFYIFPFLVKTPDSLRFRKGCLFVGRDQGKVQNLLKHLFHYMNLALKSCVSSHFGNIQFHDHGCKTRINALEPEVESCNHKIWFLQFFTALALEKFDFFSSKYLATFSIYALFSNKVH